MKACGLSGLLLLWSLPALAASPPQLFHNLGHYHRPISTHSRTAALWFDQGLRLTFAFNHDEAQRSFEQAARSDSNCAIAWWGAALTLGPNINLPAMPDRAKLAREYTLKAVALTDHASPVERSLVGALQHRYARESPAEPARQRALDSTYAAAMREVARQFPRDDDVQVLFAESLMDLSPWNHWTLDGKPQPNTLEIVQVLETVLARNPTLCLLPRHCPPLTP